MFFHGSNCATRESPTPARSVSFAVAPLPGPIPPVRRCLCYRAALAVALSGVLRRLYGIGTFSYDGRQYGGPGVQKITPIRPRDEFYQVSKNLIDPMIVRDSWRLDIVGQV